MKLLARANDRQPKIGLAILRSVLDGLVKKEQRLRLVGSKVKQVVDTQHPEAYLAIWPRLRICSSPLAGNGQLAGYRRCLRLEPPASEDSARPEETVQEVAAKMFDAMNRIAFSPGTTVTFYRLRQQPELAHIPKAIFDEAALLLQRERKALLSLHDHAPALPPEERERFVTDGLGSYYVSIYSR